MHSHSEKEKQIIVCTQFTLLSLTPCQKDSKDQSILEFPPIIIIVIIVIANVIIPYIIFIKYLKIERTDEWQNVKKKRQAAENVQERKL